MGARLLRGRRHPRGRYLRLGGQGGRCVRRGKLGSLPRRPDGRCVHRTHLRGAWRPVPEERRRIVLCPASVRASRPVSGRRLGRLELGHPFARHGLGGLWWLHERARTIAAAASDHCGHSAAPRSTQLPRHTRVVDGQHPGHDGRAHGTADRNRRRRSVPQRVKRRNGCSHTWGEHRGGLDADRAGRSARLLRVHRLRGYGQRRRGGEGPGTQHAARDSDRPGRHGNRVPVGRHCRHPRRISHGARTIRCTPAHRRSALDRRDPTRGLHADRTIRGCQYRATQLHHGLSADLRNGAPGTPARAPWPCPCCAPDSAPRDSHRTRSRHGSGTLRYADLPRGNDKPVAAPGLCDRPPLTPRDQTSRAAARAHILRPERGARAGRAQLPRADAVRATRFAPDGGHDRRHGHRTRRAPRPSDAPREASLVVFSLRRRGRHRGSELGLPKVDIDYQQEQNE